MMRTDDIIIPVQEPEKEDYYNDEGLLICGKCNTPKEAFYPKELQRDGWIKHPTECRCQREKREAEERQYKEYLHNAKIRELKGKCFPSKQMESWTFDHCILDEKKIQIGQKYVYNWSKVEADNLGLLLWGSVGTGKTYFAACIANALIEKEVSVKMTNLSAVMNCKYENRDDFIKDICRYRLLILDDFGMERDTSYGMETIYQVIDRRYQSNKPLILTTNLSLDTLKHPADLDHQRIYDRVMEMCIPIRFIGESLRTDIGKNKKSKLDEILK